MQNNRSYKKPTTIFHRNDFHTVVKIPKAVFKKKLQI